MSSSFEANISSLYSNPLLSRYSHPTQTAVELAMSYRGKIKMVNSLKSWIQSVGGRNIGAIIVRRGEPEILEGFNIDLDPWNGGAVIAARRIPTSGGIVIASSLDLLTLHFPGYPISVILYTEQLGSYKNTTGFARGGKDSQS